MPDLQAKVACDKKEEKLKKKVLDKETGYTAWNLVEELRSGQHYQLLCDSDGATEGKYPVHIELDKELAKKLGATRVVNLGKEKLPDVMKEIGMTEGFDVGLEMSGSPAGLSDMIHNMKHGGKIALLGLQGTETKVDLETVIFNGLNIRGIYGRKVWDTWYKMSTMLQAGLDISPIITHRFDIKDYEKGFEAMISGNSGKVVLDWSHIND